MDSSACDPPSGSVRVRDALVVVCSVLSHLVLVIWPLSLGIMRCGAATNTGSTNVQVLAMHRSEPSYNPASLHLKKVLSILLMC